MKRFHITPRSRRIATDAFGNRSCSSNCLNRWWPNAWRLDLYAETNCRSMELLLRQMLPRRAVIPLKTVGNASILVGDIGHYRQIMVYVDPLKLEASQLGGETIVSV